MCVKGLCCWLMLGGCFVVDCVDVDVWLLGG